MMLKDFLLKFCSQSFTVLCIRIFSNYVVCVVLNVNSVQVKTINGVNICNYRYLITAAAVHRCSEIKLSK